MKKVLLIISLCFNSCIVFANENTSVVQEIAQLQLKTMLDKAQKELNSKQIVLVVMDTNSGNILSLTNSESINTSSNNALEYLYEPGSVMKPITLALLLDKGVANPSDVVNGHNGRYNIGKKFIVDKNKFDFISAEDVIVYSSNIGIVQLAQKLNGEEFHKGLKDFGFSRKNIPSSQRLNIEMYKAICSYGYGMRSNLIQLVQAYNIFNNNGKSFVSKTSQIIKNDTAEKMKNILIKTVNEGTGKNAKTTGLIIGGKTGTAHIVEKGHYIEKYNTTFIGFANDLKGHKYTIGVLVVQPQSSNLSSQTAVPIFKKTVDIILENGYLLLSE